jgi:hypothetical protein
MHDTHQEDTHRENDSSRTDADESPAGPAQIRERLSGPTRFPARPGAPSH